MRNGFSGKVCEGAAVKEIKRGQDFEVQVIDGLIDSVESEEDVDRFRLCFLVFMFKLIDSTVLLPTRHGVPTRAITYCG